MTAKYRNILIIKMSALGDVLHALPSLHALRELYPDARITWLVEPQFADLLPGEPYIDKKIFFHKNDIRKKPFFGKLSALLSLRHELRKQHFDLVIDLQGLAKSMLIALLSGCKNRIGYCEMREGSFLASRPIAGPNKNGHVVERYRDVIRYLGAVTEKIVFPLSPSVYKNTEALRLLEEGGITGRYAVFFPGAGWATKEWAVERFAELAERFIQAGVPVVVAGDGRDRAKGEKIKQLVPLPGLLNFVEKTRLTELFCLLKNAVICVGGDTGPLHIAAAVGTPTVSLFGPSLGTRSHPIRSCIGHKADPVICATVPCSPCFKRACPKTFTCMETIGVEAVFEACKPYILPEAEKKLLPVQNTHPVLLSGETGHLVTTQTAR